MPPYDRKVQWIRRYKEPEQVIHCRHMTVKSSGLFQNTSDFPDKKSFYYVVMFHHDFSGNSDELPFLLPFRPEIDLKTALCRAV